MCSIVGRALAIALAAAFSRLSWGRTREPSLGARSATSAWPQAMDAGG